MSTPSPVRVLRRTLRIAGISLRGQAGYRADFIAGMLDGALWQTSVVVFASVLLTRFPSVDDWASADVLLLAAMRMTSHGLTSLIFGRILFVPYQLREGLIEGYLVRPMSVFQQVLVSKFNVNAFGDLLVGCTMLAVAIGVAERPWTVLRISLLVAGVIGGCLVETAVSTVLSGLALLSPAAGPWGYRFQELLSTVGNYPLSILPWLAQAALTVVLPIVFVAYLPAAAITGHTDSIGVPSWVAYASPLIAVLLYAASRRAWTACLSRYQGTNG